MASIFKHAYARNGIVYVNGTISGSRYRISTGKKVCRETLAWAERNWESLLKHHIIAKNQNQKKVGVSFESFAVASLQANKATRRELTTKEYLNIFHARIIPFFGEKSLEEITPLDIKNWQSQVLETGVSPKTLLNARIVLSTILKDALSSGILQVNPLQNVPTPRLKKPEINPFSLEEITLILQTSNGWFKHMLTLAFFTGMRTGEMLALKWEDIDFDRNIIRVNKSIRESRLTSPKTRASIREVDMLPVVKQALLEQKALKRSDSVVFPNQEGKMFSDSHSLKRYWQPLFKRLGFGDRVLYNTRHSFASLMIAQGEDILWVSKMLGHTDAQITFSRYARFIKTDKKRATFLDGFSA
ncbi:site-specific integrase [Helicobacter sp. 11S02596-1]|uniref:tyrosine-type recombinase/integrase n=1 Tax=Helicobacter sp. 11S02596-1 TaxID=1476194 RepID=UPI0015DF0FCD|nr:site-specific integrase [Helicobacter sp. 11S02596-1]